MYEYVDFCSATLMQEMSVENSRNLGNNFIVDSLIWDIKDRLEAAADDKSLRTLPPMVGAGSTGGRGKT